MGLVISGGIIAGIASGGFFLGKAAASAKNSVEMVSDILAEVITTTIQNNNTISSVVQQQSLDNCYIGGDVNWSQDTVVSINLQALQGLETNTELDQSLKVAAEQAAEAVADTLGLLSGSAEAENISKVITNAAGRVVTYTMQQCKLTSVITQKQICKGSAIGGDVIMEQSVLFTAIRQCVQSSLNQQKVGQEIDAYFSQSAKAEQKSALVWIIVAVCVFFLIFIVIIRGGAKTAQTVAERVFTWQFALGVAPVVYFVIAFVGGFWPFPRFDEESYIEQASQWVDYDLNTGNKFTYTPMTFCELQGMSGISAEKRDAKGNIVAGFSRDQDMPADTDLIVTCNPKGLGKTCKMELRRPDGAAYDSLTGKTCGNGCCEWKCDGDDCDKDNNFMFKGKCDKGVCIVK